MRLTISARLASGFLLLLALMVSLAGYAVVEAQRALETQVTVMSSEDTVNHLHAIQTRIDEHVDKVREFAFNDHQLREVLASYRDRGGAEVVPPAMETTVVSELQRFFVDYFSRRYGGRSVFSDVVAADARGRVIAATHDIPSHQVGNEPWYLGAREAGMYAGPFQYDEVAGTYGIVAAARVEDEDGSFLGVLHVFIDINLIIREVGATTPGFQSVEMRLLTADGRLLYASRTYRFYADESGREYYARYRSGERSFTAVEGVRDKLFTFAEPGHMHHFVGEDWLLVQVHDAAQLLSPVVALRDSIFFASTVLVVLAMAGALAVSRSITGPLLRLSTTAERLTDGDLEARAIVDTDDELGDLGTTFNTMAAELQVMYASLEEKVRERTAQLRNSEMRYRGLFENSPISMWEVDYSRVKGIIDELKAAGVEDLHTHFREHPEVATQCLSALQVTDMNETTVAMYGARDKQQLIDDVGSIFAPESFVIFTNLLVAIFECKTDFTDEGVTKKLTGERNNIILRWSALPGYEESLTTVVVSIVDITDRKQAEEQLKVTMTELERSNSELQQFAYVASHDLQEPLRMVTSYVQLLEKRYKGKLDEDADEFIAFAVDGSKRMKILIDDLLEFSRVESHGKPFELTDLKSALDDALANLQAAVKESDAVVTPYHLPSVHADASQLAQLFQNLIGNAIKFRGTKPPRVRVSAEEEGREWHLSVKDNGIGIDPEYKDRIFVIFQRLHGKKEFPGTGIGLAVCKRIVERHGGRIWVEGKPGKGSTFHFTLPKTRTR